MTVSIIIPNYNGEHLLKKNLPKVITALEHYVKEHKEEGEIIIVDDCSEDASVEFIKSGKLKENYVRIKLLQNIKNLGFSSAVNKGVAEASGVVVVLLNTDVTPDRNFLAPLIEHFNDERVFAIGCLENNIENGKPVLRGRGIGSWRKGFLMHQRGEIDHKNTLWASGGSSAFKKTVWDKLGGLYIIYNPFYWEDIDLSYRALKAGYTILFEENSVISHEHARGVIVTKYSQKQIKTIAYRNQFIFTWINVSDSQLIASHIFWLPLHLMRGLLYSDFPLLIGFLLALVRSAQTLRLRFMTQRLVRRSDTEVIAVFKQ